MSIATQTVRYELSGMQDVHVQRDIEYAGGLTMDMYRRNDGRSPVIVIAGGYPDPGFEKFFGCKFKDMGWTTSWARMLAASGIASVTYVNREPVADLDAVLDHVQRNGDALGVDPSRVGLLASSGHGPLALSHALRGASHVRCVALLYPVTLDLDGSTDVAGLSSQFGFANPSAIDEDDWARETPILIVRAGRDEMPRLNEAMDRFVTAALRRNMPITLVNQPDAPHAFDLSDDGAVTHDVIRQVLAFVTSALAAR